MEEKGLWISRNNERPTPDEASKGAMSRWLQTEDVRMRVLTYPPQHDGDHVCYKGHSIYVVAGTYKMEIDDTVFEWQEGDAFIIPDSVPHRSFNPGEKEAKIVIVDNHT